MVFGNGINKPPKPSTPEQAPWTDVQALAAQVQGTNSRLDQLITLLGGQLFQLNQNIQNTGGAGGGNGGSPPVTNVIVSTTPLASGALVVVFHWAYNQLVPGTYTSDMIDWSKGSRLLVKIESTLDQSVTVQPRGGIRNALDKSAFLGIPVVVPAQGNATIGFDWDLWHPNIWIVNTIAVQPNQGYLDVSYKIQS
jgi:hypothetical protein